MQATIFPVDQFFPSDKYNETCQANKALVPMYLIARNQSFKSIAEQIKKYETAGQQWNRHLEWKITCLHVAVWRQNLEVIQYLLEKNPLDVEKHDAIHFLPIHYAEAIGKSEIITLIKSAMKTDYVSHKNIWEKLLKKPTEEKDIFFHYINEEGNIMKGDSAKFAELTEGAILTQMIFFRNRTAFLENLAKTFVHSKKSMLQCEIKEITKRSQSLCLKKQGAAGWGVITLQKQEPFVPFAIYVGEGVIQAERKKNAEGDDYLLNTFEAHHFRNLAAMINDGFPNCAIGSVSEPSGICYSTILPIRPIEKGEEIFIDYENSHSIKRRVRSEFNLDEARSFLKTKGMLTICRDELLSRIIEIQQKNQNVNSERRTKLLFTQVSYLFNTPSALIRLMIEKIITANDLKTLASEKKYLPLFLNNPDKQNYFLQIAGFFEACEKFGIQNNLDVYDEIKSFFWKILDSYNIDIASVALQYLSIYLSPPFNDSNPRETIHCVFIIFEKAIPFFEIIQNCLYYQKDATEQELVTLQKIETFDQTIQELFYSFSSKISYAKLKKLLENLQLKASQETPQAKYKRITGIIRAMTPDGVSQETEKFLTS